jgi:serine/threonine protein kinase
LAKAQGFSTKQERRPRLPSIDCEQTPIPCFIRVLTYLQQEIITPTDIINKHFLDLVRKLLAFDPTQRITVREALNHHYFQLSIPDESC